MTKKELAEQREKNYRERKYFHKNIEKEIKNAKDNLDKLIAQSKLVHQFVEKLPGTFYENGGIVSTGWWYSWVSMPWDWSKVTEMLDKIKDAGFNLEKEWDDLDMAAKHFRFRHPSEEYQFMAVDIDVNPKQSGSKCVLVPIKTQTKEVVVAYDHVCPETHPDLFDFSSGKPVYKGDKLFPAK
jgi:hypothetical protein